jgi:predicted AAA+ superfamily ATPase
VDKKEDIKKLNVVKRKIGKPTKDFAIAIIGPRRAGKTFACYYLIKKLNLKDSEYLFVNFEDDEVKRNLVERFEIENIDAARYLLYS